MCPIIPTVSEYYAINFNKLHTSDFVELLKMTSQQLFHEGSAKAEGLEQPRHPTSKFLNSVTLTPLVDEGFNLSSWHWHMGSYQRQVACFIMLDLCAHYENTGYQ